MRLGPMQPPRAPFVSSLVNYFTRHKIPFSLSLSVAWHGLEPARLVHQRNLRPRRVRGDPRARRPAAADRYTAAAEMSSTPTFLDDSRMRRLVGYRLAQAGAGTNRVFDEFLGKPLALRRVDYTILVLVDANRDATNRQLARLLGLSMPYLTVTLDKLVARGLLSRVRNDVDRRSNLLRLSKAGKALLRKADLIAASMESALLGRLTQGEAAILFELLDKITSPRHPHPPAAHPESS